MTLFLYILKDYLKYVLGTIVLSVFLFNLFDFIHKTTKYFAKHEPTAEQLVQFYLFRIPIQIVQSMPIAALLASVICMILLSRTNEITAMRAAGMGPLRIGMALVVGGLLLSLVSLGLGEWLVPRYAQKMHYVQQVEIEGQKSDALAEGARWFRDGPRLVSFGDYQPLSRTLSRVQVVEIGAGFRPVQTREAAYAKYLPAEKLWRLEDVQDVFFAPNGDLTERHRITTIDMALPLEPKKLKKERRKPNELAMNELGEIIRRGDQAGADTLTYKVEFHAKMAYPFAAFVVSLIGLKFGYRSERTTETVVAVLVAFSIGISYWFIFSWSTALGKRGDLPPVVAAWAANFVTFGVVFFDYWRSRRA